MTKPIMLYTENFACKLKDFKAITFYKHELLSSGYKKPGMAVHTSTHSAVSYSMLHQVTFLGQLENSGLFNSHICSNFATEIKKLWRNYLAECSDAESKASFDFLTGTVKTKENSNG